MYQVSLEGVSEPRAGMGMGTALVMTTMPVSSMPETTIRVIDITSVACDPVMKRLA